MSERFSSLYRLPFSLTMNGCPVVIEKGALLLDTAGNKVLAQLKMLVVSKTPVRAVQVHFECRDAMGQPLNDSVDFQYKDINLSSGKTFGSNTPVFFPNNDTRFFTVTVTGAALADGTVWKNEAVAPMTELPEPASIISLLNDKPIIDQFKRETTDKALYVPDHFGDLWRCTCGKINTEEKCSECGVYREKVFRVCDREYLQNAIDEQVAREQKAAEEQKYGRFRQAAENARSGDIARIERGISELKTFEPDYNDAGAVLAEAAKTLNKLKQKKKKKRTMITAAAVLLSLVLLAAGIFVYRRYYALYPVETLTATVNLRGDMSYEYGEKLDNIQTVNIYYMDRKPAENEAHNLCFVIAHKNGIDYSALGDIDSEALSKVYAESLPKMMDSYKSSIMSEAESVETDYTTVQSRPASHAIAKYQNDSYIEAYIISAGGSDVIALFDYHIGKANKDNSAEFKWILDHLEMPGN